jgi:hypothetical protein
VVAEEVRHGDQQIAQECGNLVRMPLEEAHVGGEVRYLVHLQTAGDAAHQGWPFILAEVMPRALAREREDVEHLPKVHLLGYLFDFFFVGKYQALGALAQRT